MTLTLTEYLQYKQFVAPPDECNENNNAGRSSFRPGRAGFQACGPDRHLRRTVN